MIIAQDCALICISNDDSKGLGAAGAGEPGIFALEKCENVKIQSSHGRCCL